ncbi:MAG: GntR family transcriptional regulator [Acidibrevibacterium sp.]|uniref:GntR family transcriptional regulator n=1 Tax=Acidibrevibacterium fodinaquatile TaxID=1969806 RepID=UPI0023A80952|nr:GntR family transcriptional regulator [Acidibrevibacterium fodinaquatile]MCA7120615.1 GntR family transcriptional regulator [Acidibrevibacterium fodinaquatile]
MTEPLYEMIRHSLAQQITAGTLPPGLVLLEGPIAEAFQVSRAPVKVALRLLHEDALVQRFNGRGFIIPGRDKPLRISPREAGLQPLVDGQTEPLPRAGWERIYAEAEGAIGRALVFGRFRVLEAHMAKHFHVGRTIMRDVLSRMQERGLITKDARSHWIAGPLTAAVLREYYEIRRILEPAALQMAAGKLDADELRTMRGRVAGAMESSPALLSPDTMREIDEDLHIRCVQRNGNARLSEMIQDCHLVLLANHTFLCHLGVPEEVPELAEHLVIYDLLLQGEPKAAAVALRAHLSRSLDRALARLMVLSVIPIPPLPSFLAPTEP